MSKKEILFVLIIAVLIIIISFFIGITMKNSKNKDNTIEISEIKETTVNIPKSNEISQYFPDDITAVRIYSSSDKRSSTINDIERIKKFIQLFIDSTWEIDNTNYSNLTTLLEINIIGSTTTTFNMLGLSEADDNFGIIQVIYDNNNKFYQIPKENYLNIFGFRSSVTIK